MAEKLGSEERSAGMKRKQFAVLADLNIDPPEFDDDDDNNVSSLLPPPLPPHTEITRYLFFIFLLFFSSLDNNLNLEF